MLRHCYLTTRYYHGHPIGSRCFAFRVDCGRKLAMEFHNGDVIVLPCPDLGVDEFGWPIDAEGDLIPLWEEGARKGLNGETIEPLNEVIMEFKREAR
jgi:hypothetical protein